MNDDVIHHSMELFATPSRYVYIYKTLDNIFYISKTIKKLYHH